MSDTLIKVEGVSKKFCRSLKKSLWYGMQDLGREITGRKHGGEGELRPDEFWAVNDVSFELKRGECLGLLGRNGAGKTTLLRMLNGLIKPDRGRIEMRGRVGALIALGAGFNPILTGRENIYVNASVLGLTKQEIDAKLDEIIDFAEIGQFIDMPVQSYSSGMSVRLGFSIASTITPDILLLDEILAVGDVSFRMKCFERMRRVISQGTAGILVSHNPLDIDRVCNLGLLLKKGSSVHFGTKDEVLTAYQENLNLLEAEGENEQHRQIKLQLSKAKQGFSVETGQDLVLTCDISTDDDLEDVRFILHLSSNQGMLASTSSLLKVAPMKVHKGTSRLTLTLREIPLLRGAYSVWVDLYGPEISAYLSTSNKFSFVVETKFYDTLGYGACHLILPKIEWGCTHAR